MTTVCRDCGRELAPVDVPGNWRCGACYEIHRRETPMPDTPAARGGNAPPPPITGEAQMTPPPPPIAEPVPEPVQPVTAPQTGELVTVDDGLGDMRRTWKLAQWTAMLDDPGPTGVAAAAAIARYLVGDLRLPGAAYLEVSIIDGRPYLSARLLRILALRQGFRITPLEMTPERCTVQLEDVYGHELGRATYTIEDATRAGLAGKRNYQRDPESMLWARAARRVLDHYAPNVLFGLALPTDPPTAPRVRDGDLDFHGEPDTPFQDGGYLDDDGIPL